MNTGLIEFLSEYVSEERLQKMNEAINERTRFLTVVLEDIYQPHNASAVLRSCECFGIQDVHIIENRNKYEVNPDVVQGSQKWLSMHTYSKEENNTLSCLKNLKDKGYKLVATVPGAEMTLHDLQPQEPMAFMMGTELTGLSKTALDMADMTVTIPMTGFTQSLNISVSAALILFDQISKLKRTDLNWQLEKDQKNEIMLNWLRGSIKKPHLLEEVYKNRIQEKRM